MADHINIHKTKLRDKYLKKNMFYGTRVCVTYTHVKNFTPNSPHIPLNILNMWVQSNEKFNVPKEFYGMKTRSILWTESVTKKLYFKSA